MVVLKTYIWAFTHVAACSPAPSLPAKGCNSPPCLSRAPEERPSPFPGSSRRGVTWLWAWQALTSHSTLDSSHYLLWTSPNWGLTSAPCRHSRLWTPQVTSNSSKRIKETLCWRKRDPEMSMPNSPVQPTVALQYHIPAYKNTHTHLGRAERMMSCPKSESD